MAYLAKGGTDVWWKMAWEGTAFLPDPAGNIKTMFDATQTFNEGIRDKSGDQEEPIFVLKRSELLKDGSFLVPLQDVDEFEVVEYRDFGFPVSYLRVCFMTRMASQMSLPFRIKRKSPGKGSGRRPS